MALKWIKTNIEKQKNKARNPRQIVDIKSDKKQQKQRNIHIHIQTKPKQPREKKVPEIHLAGKGYQK